MKKRVALVSAFYPYRGGIAQFGANLYRALEGLDIVVDAYTFRRQYPKILFPGKTQLVENGDKADHIPAERIIDSINPISYRTAAKKIEANHPQVLITQYWMTFFAPSFGFISKYFRQKRVKRISILHNVIPHEKKFFDTRANRYFLAQHDGFVVMSDAVLADLLLFKPDAKYIRIDHPSYDHFGAAISRQEALEALNLDLSKKFILFFGFIRKYKGLDVLIQAIKDLGEDIHLIVAGEAYGSMEDYMQQINDFGLQDRVHLYTDYIADEQVKVFFSAADLCVLPYRSATQSGITAIAHHFCVPVIATNVGGLSEVISDGNDGIIVDQADAHLIANAIKKAYREDLIVKFRSQLKTKIDSNGWKKFAKAIIDFSDTL